MDQTFDVFVGQVGYWLPWDPESSKVDNQEYLNDNLNKLVKEYKSNEIKKDMFYQEQTRQRKQEAMSVAERLKKKLEAKRREESSNNEIKNKNNEEVNSQLEENFKKELDKEGIDNLLSSNTDTVSVSDNTNESSTPFSTEERSADTLENTVDALQNVDPWMQRKLENKE
jgi:hypothetical protein